MSSRRPESRAERAYAFGAPRTFAAPSRPVGRDVGGASFERQVLSELRGLRRDVRAMKNAMTGGCRKA